MVACALASSHPTAARWTSPPTDSVVCSAPTAPAAGRKGVEAATAALSGGGGSNPLLQPMMVRAAIEQLQHQLQTAADNNDVESTARIIEALESTPLTKEILESTRVGLTVNNIRREIQEKMPALSKRCRALIKAWQKLVEPSLSSNSASHNGTPCLISPAVGRLQTPRTGGMRVSSAGLTNESRSATISPANGSYAPKSTSSPGRAALHKSHSVGVDLAARGEENRAVMRNGKRRTDEGNPVPYKRTKTTASGLSSLGVTTTPPTPSVTEARKNAVLSTTELVAQMTSNLSEQKRIGETLREHEEKVKRELADEQLAQDLASNGNGVPEKKKRKYERKGKQEVRITAPPEEERRGGLVLRLSRNATECTLLPTRSSSSEKEEKKEKKKSKKKQPSVSMHPSKSAPSLSGKVEDEPMASTSKDAPIAAGASGSSEESAMESKEDNKPFDWMSILPSIEELNLRAEKEKEADEKRMSSMNPDPLALQSVFVQDHYLPIMPYLECDDVPDFIRYEYPNPRRFISARSLGPYSDPIPGLDL